MLKVVCQSIDGCFGYRTIDLRVEHFVPSWILYTAASAALASSLSGENAFLVRKPATAQQILNWIAYKRWDAVQGFGQFDNLPSEIRPFIQFWDNGSGIEAGCESHRACWRNPCNQKLLHSTKFGPLQNSSTDVNRIDVNNNAFANEDMESNTVEPMPKLHLTHSASGSVTDHGLPVCFLRTN